MADVILYDNAIGDSILEVIVTARPGSFTICTPDGQPYAGGMHIKRKRPSLADNRMILRDSFGLPIAVCIRYNADDFGDFEDAFRIYAFKAIVSNQSPSKRKKYEGRHLFEWSEVKKCSHTGKIFMTVSGGNFFASIYNADHISLSEKIKQPAAELNAVTKCGQECFVMKQKGSGFNSTRWQSWSVCIAPCIDPYLALCFSVIVHSMT